MLIPVSYFPCLPLLVTSLAKSLVRLPQTPSSYLGARHGASRLWSLTVTTRSLRPRFCRLIGLNFLLSAPLLVSLQPGCLAFLIFLHATTLLGLNKTLLLLQLLISQRQWLTTLLIPNCFCRPALSMSWSLAISLSCVWSLVRCRNDVAIAHLHPMPNHQVNFAFIRNSLSEFLNVQRNIATITVQPCPYGQAYVSFARMFERDMMIQNSPHQFGNGHISFIPHNSAWNNRVAVFTHEVWVLLIGLNFDLWTHSLIDKAIS